MEWMRWLILWIFCCSPVVAAEKQLRSKVLSSAKSLIKTPYRFGGNGKKGLDCSAFTQNVYSKSGIKIPRTVRGQARTHSGQWVKNPKPGDLVFFKNTYKRGLSHVGIFSGNQKMIHASASKKRVEEASLDKPYFKKRLIGFKSLIGNTEQQVALTKSYRSEEKPHPIPFFLVAAGVSAGILGGMFAEDTDDQWMYALSGFGATALGVTWRQLQR